MNQKKLKRVIGIDGPVASGKTDIGLSLAKILGWKFLDTGFMYRAIAFSTKQFKGFDKNPSSMKKTLSSAQFCFDQSYPGTLLFNNQNLGLNIHTKEIDQITSKISQISEIRENLVNKQRQLADQFELIAAGRDVCTVVFPQALCKFFLTASPEIRAKRRYMQLKTTKSNIEYDSILEQINKRDKMDTTRSISPLKPANDSIVINTDNVTINEVVEKIHNIIIKKLCI